MKAWISGANKRAVLRSEKGFLMLSNEDSKAKDIASSSTALMLISGWQDVYLRDVASLDEAAEELRRASHNYNALFASSVAMDESYDIGRRRTAAVEADSLLQESFVWKYVLSVYYAREMPPGADLRSTQQICERDNLVNLRMIVQTLNKYKAQITAVRDAWEVINASMFESPQQRALFKAEAIRYGLFFSLANRISDTKQLESFTQSRSDFRLNHLANMKTILNAWVQEAMKITQNHATESQGSESPFAVKRKSSSRFQSHGTPAAIYAGVINERPAFALAFVQH